MQAIATSGRSAGLVVAGVWMTIVCVSRSLAGRVGPGASTLIAFAAAAAIVLATRDAAAPRCSTRAVGLCGIGAAIGAWSFPAFALTAASVGSLLGLEPRAVRSPGLEAWPATLVLAPLFEELLYRERLISALRPRVGSVLAVVASSVPFALSHVEPWAVVGTLVVGLALGALFTATGSVALCIGMHAGLNAAARA